MTVQAHDQVALGPSHHASAPSAVDRAHGAPARRWWRPLAAVIATLVVGGLVVAGVLPLSTVVYLGLFGGMLLMHAGGHGHGAHTGHATASNGDRGTGPTPQAGAEGDEHRSHGCH